MQSAPIPAVLLVRDGYRLDCGPGSAIVWAAGRWQVAVSWDLRHVLSTLLRHLRWLVPSRQRSTQDARVLCGPLLHTPASTACSCTADDQAWATARSTCWEPAKRCRVARSSNAAAVAERSTSTTEEARQQATAETPMSAPGPAVYQTRCCTRADRDGADGTGWFAVYLVRPWYTAACGHDGPTSPRPYTARGRTLSPALIGRCRGRRSNIAPSQPRKYQDRSNADRDLADGQVATPGRSGADDAIVRRVKAAIISGGRPRAAEGRCARDCRPCIPDRGRTA